MQEIGEPLHINDVAVNTVHDKQGRAPSAGLDRDQEGERYWTLCLKHRDERPDCRRMKQRRQRQVALGPPAYFGEQDERQKRMAAEFEEVIVQPDRRDMEDPLPDGLNLTLERR